MRQWTIIIITILLGACDNLSKNGNVFESEKLRGKYKVDITPLYVEYEEEIMNKEDDNSFVYTIGKGLVKLVLYTTVVEMSFYENNKGVIYVGGAINLFIDDFKSVGEFTYKVVDDSVLYMKYKGEDDFEKMAIVRKFSESYDYLQFLVVQEGKDKVYLDLKKIDE